MEVADLRVLWLRAWEKAESPPGLVATYTSDLNYLATTIVWETGGRKQDVYRAMELRQLLPGIPEFEGRYSIVPCGKEVLADVVVATDVIEHVGKHLNFLRWVGELSEQGFILTYPAPIFYELSEWKAMGGGRLAVVKK